MLSHIVYFKFVSFDNVSNTKTRVAGGHPVNSQFFEFVFLILRCCCSTYFLVDFLGLILILLFSLFVLSILPFCFCYLPFLCFFCQICLPLFILRRPLCHFLLLMKFNNMNTPPPQKKKRKVERPESQHQKNTRTKSIRRATLNPETNHKQQNNQNDRHQKNWTSNQTLLQNVDVAKTCAHEPPSGQQNSEHRHRIYQTCCAQNHPFIPKTIVAILRKNSLGSGWGGETYHVNLGGGGDVLQSVLSKQASEIGGLVWLVPLSFKGNDRESPKRGGGNVS